ncbi:MAG TPA: L,D-transpeptidase [Afifellaceae bacterium]|nr:L,D-transpeptidase [Afifellaceae bacterium]
MSEYTITRRALALGGLALLVAGCTPGVRQAASTFMPTARLDPQYRRQRVKYHRRERPGTIVVDTKNFFLYHVEHGGTAMRYGVGVGRDGSSLRGLARVGRKAEWPSWTPTANMMRRDPRLLQYASGVPGGPQNPLGARALYLYRGNRDTMYRLHGTNEPWSIGQRASSGCIRLLNDDIVDLYERTPVGTQVLII